MTVPDNPAYAGDDMPSHNADYAGTPDPLVEQVEDECPTCGAWMLNPALHKDWHREMSRRIGDISREAVRYKPPPTYR